MHDRVHLLGPCTTEKMTENIDKAGPGLAAYLRDAILANAERHG
ncbi:hypothetical protein SMF913_14364 [Streptomyces malaysiensis]|uniref:Uncharacterized protein n=1 Tax=Streptomyces malaysiensis TaxID=92644 RepID=A0A2J7ZDP8_STRMQ|nr:hypothetical protein SMF913_14364 [Streptomyces malaysiensis]